MSPEFPSDQEYLERIEKCFQALRERPLVLSPEDLQRVLRWHATGIPLALVLEVMDDVFHAAELRRPRRKPRSLAYCAPAVEEAWEDLREGRVGRRRMQRAAPDPSLDEALRGVTTALQESAAPRPVVDEIVGALGALAAGEGEGRLEDDVVSRLEERLLAACFSQLDAASRSAVELEAETEIARFTPDMTPELRERLLSRARARLLRSRFRLPDLSLLPLL